MIYDKYLGDIIFHVLVEQLHPINKYKYFKILSSHIHQGRTTLACDLKPQKIA